MSSFVIDVYNNSSVITGLLEMYNVVHMCYHEIILTEVLFSYDSASALTHMCAMADDYD